MAISYIANCSGPRGCGARYRTMGNLVGHCSGCHRSFQSEEAFDRHQTVRDGRVACRDPASMTRADGSPLYEVRVDDVTSYWRIRQTEAQKAKHYKWLQSVKSTQGTGGGHPEVE